MADNLYHSIQAAVRAELLADPEIVSDIDDRVYSERAPQSARRPYLRFNDMSKRPVRSTCGRASDVILSIEAHCRSDLGDTEAKDLGQRVEDVLDGADLALSLGTLVYLRYVTDTVGLEKDGQNYSAIVVFEALIDR